MKRPQGGFTLVEVLIVVAIMAILAAAAIPLVVDTSGDAKKSAAVVDLRGLRSQIELYRLQHNGTLPSLTLVELTSSTNASGTIGAGVTFPYGPYMPSIPLNPYTKSAKVAAAGANPPTSTVPDAGWLYDVATGKIWINDTTIPFAQQ